jgi:pyruvate formate lyase activating enzyme
MAGHFSIKGLILTSLIEWPGRVCSVLFLGGCNFRCPTCHNHRLVLEPESLRDYSLPDVLERLEDRKHWIDGVAITGGEPTFSKDLPDLLGILRKMGMSIKLDTNGSNPRMLEEIVESRLVDAVFMDVKAPLMATAYSRAAGVTVNTSAITRSIDILKGSGLEVVFRTTVIPGLVAEPELVSIVNSLGKVERFTVQPFRNVSTLDPQFLNIEEYTMARIDVMRQCFEIPAHEVEFPTFSMAV